MAMIEYRDDSSDLNSLLRRNNSKCKAVSTQVHHLHARAHVTEYVSDTYPSLGKRLAWSKAVEIPQDTNHPWLYPSESR